jgi:DSF synthase
MSAVASHLSVVDSPGTSRFQQITPYYDATYETSWIYMHATPRPCFTPRQLGELKTALSEVREQGLHDERRPVRYNVIASDVSGVFSLGGDLDLFKRLVLARDRDALTDYALACIDNVYTVSSRFRGAEITNITLVQGRALGGVMECALAADVVIAERSARMGLPEVIFNLFPGMGAYSILSRKLSPAAARRMILSGKVYSAEELYELGVVDVLAEDFQGELAVYDYIKERNRASNAYDGLTRAIHAVDAVSYEELEEIALIWVDAVLKLDRRDLRMMERLVSRQSRGFAGQTAAVAVG